MVKTCGNCALHNCFGGCPIFKMAIPPESPGCIKWEAQLENCEICGGPTIGGVVACFDVDSDQLHLICNSCAQNLGKCPTCKLYKECLFQTDPSPIPPTIVQTVRQGNMISQMTVPNPERVAITCQKCKCWNASENYCFKQNIGNCLKGGWEGAWHELS